MNNYVPGEGYEKGYSERMKGGHLPPQAMGTGSDPYWQEYAIGWKDADTKIINQARQKNDSLNESKKDKTFIQD